MSWWDTSAFSNLASQAIKTAQQRIDKVLDIKDEEDEGQSSTVAANSLESKPSEASPSGKEESKEDDKFWSSYLGGDSLTGFTSTPSKKDSVSKPTARTALPSLPGIQSAVTSERKDIKVSATSAFTVRSKRVESTLKKFNVKSDLVEVPFRESQVKIENIVQKEYESVIKEGIKFDVTEEHQECRDATELKVGVPAEETELAKPTNVEDKREQSISDTLSSKKSAPLKLGKSLVKKKAEQQEKKKIEEKQEIAMVEAQVEKLFESNLNISYVKPSTSELPSDSMVESEPNLPSVENVLAGIEQSMENLDEPKAKPPDVMAAGQLCESVGSLVLTDSTCGWDAEEIDIEGLSEVDSIPDPQNPGPSDEVHAPESETLLGEEDASKSEAVLDEEGKVNPLDQSTTNISVTTENAKTDNLQEIKIEEEDTDEEPPNVQCAESSIENLSEEDSFRQELCNIETDEEKVVVLEETGPDELVESILSRDDENLDGFIKERTMSESTITEAGDKLEVSVSSSDTTEGTGDELSDSNKTMTGDDFKVPPQEKSDIQKLENKPESSETEKATEGEMPSEVNIEINPDIHNCRETKEDQNTENEQCTDSLQNAEIQDSNHKAMAEDEKKDNLLSSSYVKNMLEEAMVESVKDTDSHSSSSTSDKSSEMVRIESGLNSGHTSGDEIDTTTSSDIEIISTPTPNGEYRHERPFDLSPLRHALSRTMRRGSPPGHKRSDSSSSVQSTWSKNGDDLLGADGGHLAHETLEEDPENRHAEAGDMGHISGDALDPQILLQKGGQEERKEGIQANPFQHLLPSPPTSIPSPSLDTIEEKCESPDNLTTNTEHPTNHQTSLMSPKEVQEKLAKMAEVLEAREKKLVDFSRENIELEEAKSILKNQLKQSEEAREAELEDLNTITEEFTARLADFEQRLQSTVRERDNLKKQLSGAQGELTKKSSSSSGLERLLKEKDQQISELLEEGEKLSKQQLQSNNVTKKLRAKEKDNDALLKSQKTKLEQQADELAHLRKVLDAKEELEKKQIEAINQQNIAVKKMEGEMQHLKGENEDMQEKARGLQAALDNSYKEISELHKAKASALSENQTARLSVEMQAKQELQLTMERMQQTHKHEIEAFFTQMEDLQMSLVRQEREQGRREDVLRQEISDLQQRLQEAEERNQDLTQSVTSATRPLLRQIENLQSTYSVHTGSYEKLERNLTERLNEAQTSLAEAVEKERASNERLLDVQSRLTSLETQVSSLRQEKSRLSAHLEMEKTKIVVLEDAKNSETAQLEALKNQFSDDITSLKKDKLLLEHLTEMEKMKTEAEKKKLILAHEQLRDKELQLQRQAMTPSPRSSLRDESIISIHSEPTTPMSMSLTQDEIMEKTLMFGSTNGSSSSLYESLRHTGAATLLENLQSQLKLKEGEIVQLQSEIKDLEQTRESMARELVNLSGINDELEQKLDEYPVLKQAHQEMDSRYQALLQMYGEKVEEAEELNMDLHDIKDMYKAQIEELLKRVR